MLRQGLLWMSRSSAVQTAVTNAPVTRTLVSRFIAGDTGEQALEATRQVIDDGLQVTLDFLGEDTLDIAQADYTRDAYLTMLTLLSDAGLASRAEVSVKLSAVGQALPGDGDKIATANAYRIAEAANAVGTTVTIDMEDHTTTDRTLETVRVLRADFPWVGAVLQSYLHRTEADCRDLATAGSRVRLCKGAYKEPESVAFQAKHDVNKSYVRCLKALMAGNGYPMVASHDPKMIEIAGALADRYDRDPSTYEYQMLYGIRPDEHQRLSASGETMRLYLPYGDEWYGYLMRRLAERPANLAFFARGLVQKG